MKSFVKLSICKKILFVFGAALIGAGIGNLIKGYNDRITHVDGLGELVSKTLNGHSNYYDESGQAEVRIELSKNETSSLLSHQLYENRLRTSLTRIPSYANLASIVIGTYLLVFLLRTKQEVEPQVIEGDAEQSV